MIVPSGWTETDIKNIGDLIMRLLKYDPNQRLTASDCLKHDFFSELIVNTNNVELKPADNPTNKLESKQSSKSKPSNDGHKKKFRKWLIKIKD